MSDFVDYEPKVQATAFRAPVGIRAAVPADVGALAAVMSVRGGASVDYVERAGRLIGHLPVLLMAEADRRAVGWCGIQKISIFPGVDPGWLIAGITVVPEQRRRGVAAQLLHGVVSATTDATPGEPVFSVINVGNQASIDLHEALGFVEVARGATFAGIEFTGGEGVLLRHSSFPSLRVEAEVAL